MNIYNEILKIEQGSKKAALCTITETKGSTPRKAASKMIVFEDSSIIGTVGGGGLEFEVIKNAVGVIKSQKTKVVRLKLAKDLQMSCGGYAEIFIEPIVNRIKLYIFGAGHIGRLTAKYAADLDFNVFIIDERPNIFSEFDTEGYTLINKNHNDAFQELIFDTHTFIASITHQHGYDKQVVEYCITQPNSYIGAIASTAKAATIKRKITEAGKVNPELLMDVDWPMGINIKCQTPEEITISIVAKLIDVRSNLLNSEN